MRRNKRKAVIVLELDNEDDLLTEEERLLIASWFTAPVVFVDQAQEKKPRRRTRRA